MTLHPTVQKQSQKAAGINPPDPEGKAGLGWAELGVELNGGWKGSGDAAVDGGWRSAVRGVTEGGGCLSP